jgi:hypothetical protein
MSLQVVKVGDHVFNLSAVSAAHWEGQTLYVHLFGGHFVSFKGTKAQLVWQFINERSIDLETGEVK